MTARRWYAHITGLSLDSLAATTAYRWIVTSAAGVIGVHSAMTASRIVATDANGMPTSNASLTSNRVVYADGTGSLASNAALTQNRVVTADSNGLPASAAAITASRMLVSDTNGVPTHGSATTTEANYVSGVTSAIQTQLNAKEAILTFNDTGRIDHTRSTNTITSDIVSGSVTQDYLGAQAAGNASASAFGASGGMGTSYANFHSASFTCGKTTSKLVIIATIYHVYSSGTTMFRITRSSNLVGNELTTLISGLQQIIAVESPNSTSSLTYNVEAKNSTPAGTAGVAQLSFIEIK